jgi:2-amino-4-hydroxy-6-hydroxymethyldihydropteridine diphosphokinase
MILIAVGANLPSPGKTVLQNCEAAVAAVRALPGMNFVALSTWYRSAPIPNSDQPDYCNGVIRLEGQPDPAGLMMDLLLIEDRFGRTRENPNAARTLDLDLIDLNGVVRTDPSPILPHPRAHTRAFVLRPILDVAPGWRHPTKRASVVTLFAELPQQEIQPWGD